MLNKINGSRYCKFEQISSHPWFRGLNWNNVLHVVAIIAILVVFGIAAYFTGGAAAFAVFA